MKFKLSLFAAGFFLIFVSFAFAAQKTSSEKFITRKQFAKLIQFDSELKRPKDRISLAEAAVLLTKSFSLEIPHIETQPTDPWYKPYLLALEEQNAIPISFWIASDSVTFGEAKEMLDRLANKISDRPSMTYDILSSQRIPYRSEEFLRLHGDFSKPLSGPILTSKIIRLFQEPGTYNIFDNDDPEAPTNYCHEFYTYSGKIGSVTTVVGQGVTTVTIEALSTDYCVFPYEDMEPGECPEDALYNDDPRCNIGKAREYKITLEKRGKKLFVKGAESSRIRITRAPLEAICKEWAAVCPGFYYPTKTETVGEVSVTTLPDGSEWNVYRTAWKPIFADLRGVNYMAFEKTLSDGAIWKKIHYGPEHNRDAWGHGKASYEDCIIDPVSSPIASGITFDFCMKREGNFFFVASKKELGDKATFWIDENFRR